MPNPQPIIATGMAVGLESLTNLEFEPNKPYRACLICGEVYQTQADRDLSPSSYPQSHVIAQKRRDLWAQLHSKTHSDKSHKLLKISGMAMTANAAHKLAAFGLISVIDMVMAEEITAALAEAPAIPQDDAVNG